VVVYLACATSLLFSKLIFCNVTNFCLFICRVKWFSSEETSGSCRVTVLNNNWLRWTRRTLSLLLGRSFLIKTLSAFIFCLRVNAVLISWEWYTLVISFVSKGFPYKDQIEELLIVMVYCVYSQHVTLSTFSLISLFTSNILIKGTI